MNKQEEMELKRQVTLALRSEDVVLMELIDGFDLDEVSSAYKMGLDATKSLPGGHDVIAESLLAIGMAAFLRSMTEKMKRHGE